MPGFFIIFFFNYDHLSYNLIERPDKKYQKHYNEKLQQELKERNLLYNIEAWKNFKDSPLTGYFNIYPEEHLLAMYK